MSQSRSVLMMVLLSAFCLSRPAQADETQSAPPAKKTANTSLTEELKALDSDNKAPAAVSHEKMYAVQSRYLPLRFKSEFTAGGGYNLTSDSFLATEQLELGYNFHFNDRWSIAIHQAWVNNQFKSEAYNLRTVDNAIPQVPYSVTRSDIMVEYNLFYGKFRLGSDTVFYFDQYWALGPGLIGQNTGKVGAAVGDAGLVLWLGKSTSARVGLKEYYYNETYVSGTQTTSNLHAHMDMGILF